MSNREKWRCVRQLTIYQIALLIEGYDPSDYECVPLHYWHPDVRADTAAILSALRSSIEEESLPLHRRIFDSNSDFEIDYDRSLVQVDVLRRWLVEIGRKDGFFIPRGMADELDNVGVTYAPKLAAANAAHKAVSSNPKLLRGKSPKKAIEAWLREHAAEFDLLNKDGTPNATGIEEIAKVANWKPAGGAPPTPKLAELGGGFNQTPGLVPENLTQGSSETFLDDEIPF